VGQRNSSFAVIALAFTDAPGLGSRHFTQNYVYDHNTVNAGASPINSCSQQYNLYGCGTWPTSESATSVQITYNIMPWPRCYRMAESELYPMRSEDSEEYGPVAASLY
jgi:hypothetical protein